MGKFDEADSQKSYARAQGKDDETAAIVSRSCQIERKLQTWTKTEPLPGFNIAPNKYPSITLDLTLEGAEYEDNSLLGGESLALDPSGGNISLLGDEKYLIGGDVYPPEDACLEASNSTGHISA